jgi:FAD/FMN-containing dehydrogenase
MIARCAGVDDVRRAIEFARNHELLTSVRSGGHSFAGHGVCDAGMVIDLSLIKHATIEPGRQLITIGGGVANAELDCMAQAFKLATPLGSCMTVGVSGYALGGGESSLTPKCGKNPASGGDHSNVSRNSSPRCVRSPLAGSM